jgi:hypothetical protein
MSEKRVSIIEVKLFDSCVGFLSSFKLSEKNVNKKINIQRIDSHSLTLSLFFI